MDEWGILVTNELRILDQRRGRPVQGQVVDAIDRLAEAGLGPGRPLVDRLEGPRIHNLKELRPGSAGRTEIRILFKFDPWRSAILLIGGDKSGNWSGWYTPSLVPKASTRSI
ncbi:type II toxin-antitoxin system RelE/ParE family toxin [Actinoallomurus sp. CA-150999]|uniref:type II toxin-antitoxin system RelE/ParE family toxin n=1 Tax=Actinoallomurus sp. CA-150999 TaxID=3239887 RepID=UPI003D8F31FA